MGSIERKVWIFKTAETLPAYEDSYNGMVLAMTVNGDWANKHIDFVIGAPAFYVKWMQYPNLADHIKEFSYE